MTFSFQLLFLHMFPLLPEEVPLPEHGVQFWTDTKIKEVVKLEIESEQGILFRSVPSIPNDSGTSSSPPNDGPKHNSDNTFHLPDVNIFKEAVSEYA